MLQTAERGMRSQVSDTGKVEVKCFRVFEISKVRELEKPSSLQLGRPAFSFMDQKKDLGYMRERGEK
jgi:hypothetical protein